FFAPDRLGPTRLGGAYAWRSMLDAGAVVAGGSDAPVEVGSPLIEFYAASVRKSLDGFSDENWRREERITPEETLAIFTTGPAYAAFAEGRRGKIKEGWEADLTAFDTDLLAAPGPDILKAKALLAVVDGRVVYRQD
ncbi:MAG: amidohydrolase family protein, partial [Pseudomonadota bacterium]